MDNWYALQVATGREADVCAMLRRTGIQAIAPAVWRAERKDGWWRTVNRCALPGYAFVRCQMNAQLYYHLMRKPGVIKLLGQSGSRFAAIPDDQIRWIIALHSACGGEIAKTSHVIISDDDGRIEIMDGPLLALKDKVTKVDIRRKRATVTLDIYGDTYEIDMAVDLADKHPESPAG